jgi:hypothetical protein
VNARRDGAAGACLRAEFPPLGHVTVRPSVTAEAGVSEMDASEAGRRFGQP